MLKRNILLVLLLVSYLPAKAQIWIKSYIVTKKSDTLKGQILYNWNGNPAKEITFKQNKEEKNSFI